MISTHELSSPDQIAPGTWQTIGYNKGFEISAERFSIYDLSEISCILSKEGSARDFRRVFDRLERDQSGQLHFYARGGITRYDLRPISRLPASCRPAISARTAPAFNFEVFWHYFKENYAFFELRKMDWESVYQEYRSQVDEQTDDQRLAGILTHILRDLNDSHATLDIPGETITTRKVHALVRQWQKEFGSDQFLELYPRGIPRLLEALNTGIMAGKGRSALNGQLLWGEIEPRIGYLGVFSMMDMYADFSLLHYAGFEVTNQGYLAELGEAVDQAVSDLQATEALIVDVRFNPGGHDAAGRVIASRFADRKRLAFTKQARSKGGFTPPQEIHLEPGGATRYTRPVYLLTSEATASAAETFVYFMMALPHVTRLGGKTRGVLSDTLLMRLPNGWVTSISNEVYATAAGTCYEGSGIPPQVEAPVFNPDNFYGDLNLTVQKAVSIIKHHGV
jgi:carboxyl-terminal processing protease